VTAADDEFLNRAAAAAGATMRRGAGGPFGAVIAKGSRVLAVGSNTVLGSHDPTCHAEINAIRAAARRLQNHLLHGTTIYSTTEPCPMCFSAIHWAQIRQVVYSTTIADVKRLGFNELTVSNRRLKLLGKSGVQLRQVANDACRALLKEWSVLPGRRLY
jgi:guanine deaminase